MALMFAGCEAGQVTQAPFEGDPNEPDGGALVPSGDESGGPDASVDAASVGMGITIGGTARVTAGALNLRDGVGTSANILVVMPCGAQVTVLGGPSTMPAVGWWNVSYQGQTGWASGKYLVAESAFDPSVCMMSLAPPPDAGPEAGSDGGGGITADDIFASAKLGVGYSYYWGHGSWRADHAQLGTCTGTCPSCTHTGQYGADCSGFVAKVWQVPGPSALDVDLHPYSTYNFYNEQIYWKQVPRSTLQPADALVHRTATEGHIALYESGSDPFGNVWLYEARGCATGIVHDLRTPDSTYIAIRRNGL
jgi:hypothetical protein